MQHLIAEVARLGLTEKFEGSARSDWRVLGELQRWFDEQPSREIGEIGHWLYLDVGELLKRHNGAGSYVKPRIEVTAEITSKDNLTVRWFPSGYHAAPVSFHEDVPGYQGDLKMRRFATPPDFRWFMAGEQYAGQRPNHEIMFIRGVGNLRPEPNVYGPYAICNYDVLDALLLCATRAAFDQLIKGLRESFEVTLLNDFEFDFEEEQVPTPAGTSTYTRSFVNGWRVVSVPPPPAPAPRHTGDVVQLKPRDDE